MFDFMARCYGKRISGFLSAISDLGDREAVTLSKFFDTLSVYRSGFAAKFKNGESVDVCFGLNVDTRKPDQMIRGSCILPHGNGAQIKVALFGDVDVAGKAMDIGASIAGGVDLVDNILSGKYVCGKDFNVCLATPAMMVHLSKVAKILGPRGLMPNVKLGTVAEDILPVLRETLRGRVQFKADKDGFVRVSLARLLPDFTDEHIKNNLLALYNVLKGLKPASVKANYLSSIRLSTTMMGCSFGIKTQELLS
jgi:large subunit ribosomal protein L1